MDGREKRTPAYGAVRYADAGREVVMRFPDDDTLAAVMAEAAAGGMQHDGRLIVSARPIDGDEAAEIGACSLDVGRG